MFIIDLIDSSNNVSHETIYNYNDDLPMIARKFEYKRHERYVSNIILTFDIEASVINAPDKHIAFMYQWQLGINDKVYMGRTWREFLLLLRKIEQRYAPDAVLVCYVHFLSYEYQFLRDFLQFDKVFATKPHKILFCRWKNIEFRCSYLLSNMSLEKWTKNCKVKYIKTKEYFDYDILRTPTTPLTNEELKYCYIDVRSLYDCVVYQMQNEHDTITTIPYTSTGYVRRHAKLHMAQNKNNWNWFNKSELTIRQYELLKLIFRGGNTSGNRFLLLQTLENLHSIDKKSSYPYQMYSKVFPQGQFMLSSRGITINDILLQSLDTAFMTTITFHNINLKIGVPIPYISFSKCWVEGEYTNVNGRITNAYCLTTSITEIDLAIIINQYDFDKYTIGETYQCPKSKLPDELIDSMLTWFIKKCELSCDEASEEYYFYMRSKNYLNAYFGMFVSDIIHHTIVDNYKNKILHPLDNSVKSWLQELDTTPEVQLSKYYNSRNNFLPYQVGIWITAEARKELQEAIDITGMDTVYVDTDSDKYLNDYHDEIENLNRKIIDNSFSYTVNGETQTLGIWEFEKDIKRFKTLGAKKYYCEYPDGKRKITVSGLSKTMSLNVIKSIDDFDIDTIIDSDNSGRTTTYYNDRGIHYIYVNGERILSASNIGMEKTTYTLGISNELDKILRMLGVIKNE